MTTVQSYTCEFVQVFAVSVSSFDRFAFRQACASYASISVQYVEIISVQSTTFSSTTTSSSFVGRKMLQGGEGTEVKSRILFPEGQVSDPQGAAGRFRNTLQSNPQQVFSGAPFGEQVQTRSVGGPSQQGVDFRRTPNGNLFPTSLLRNPDQNGIDPISSLRSAGVTLPSDAQSSLDRGAVRDVLAGRGAGGTGGIGPGGPGGGTGIGPGGGGGGGGGGAGFQSGGQTGPTLPGRGAPINIPGGGGGGGRGGPGSFP